MIKLQNRSINFTCGFFDIDLTLALSIFGTIATYMVIIFQFDNPKEKATNELVIAT
jgi:hypothetical protein